MILCDEVFDILTRGPFPTGAPSDGIVESHLTQCDGCRQLAEALRPAVELFQEAVTPEESRTLPAYWGESSSNLTPWLSIEKIAPSQVAQRTRRAVRQGARTRRLSSLSSISLRPAARLAAALLLGMALAGLLRQLGSAGDDFQLATVAPGEAEGKTRWLLAERGAHWFERNKLSEHCIAEASGPRLVAAPGGNRSAVGSIELACCSSCHVASGSVRRMTSRSTSTLVTACRACHPPIE
jgi:hypothetical protein